jgi:hypothetical protein
LVKKAMIVGETVEEEAPYDPRGFIGAFLMNLL